MTVAVIFSSTRTPGVDEEYEGMAVEMDALAAAQPGYRGHESARGADGFGITVSYWVDDQAARDWKQVAQHLQAQRLGRERWYSSYRVVVADVIREYDFSTSNPEPAAPRPAR